MANLKQQLKKAKNLTANNLEQQVFDFVKKIDKQIFDANMKQLDQGENAEGKLLTNKDKKYTGLYTKFTEELSKESSSLLPKIEGEPYNFVNTGDFIKGFNMKVTSKGVEINSTGTGTGDKKLFFDGYTDLFGLL